MKTKRPKIRIKGGQHYLSGYWIIITKLPTIWKMVPIKVIKFGDNVGGTNFTIF